MRERVRWSALVCAVAVWGCGQDDTRPSESLGGLGGPASEDAGGEQNGATGAVPLLEQQLELETVGVKAGAALGNAPDAPNRPAMMMGGGLPRCERTIRARVVAIDQPYTYNRFGSFNPAGMIYALRHDVVASDGQGTPGPGNAMLRPDKRPRPLVLRANVGDCLEVEFTNWLAVDRDDIRRAPDVPFHVPDPGDGRDNSPATRAASFHVNGLHVLDIDSIGANVGNNGSALAAPGETRTYRYIATREGTYLAHSMGAIAGGEGDGGSLVHGLFGSVSVQPRGAVWYRSQVTAAQLAAATKGRNPDGTPKIDYDAKDPHGKPILRMLDDNGQIVHSDLTAIVAGYQSTEYVTTITPDRGAYREMVVFFHDELNAVQAFPELEEDPTLVVTGDINGINLGASGMGATLLANRKRIGPSARCIECAFEEFFLTSWANGDPALNVEVDGNGKAVRALYPDDPSNVWHSYLGDPMRIRNIHSGPAETHVFHLHAHQWLQSPGSDNDAYVDAQSISPGSSFTYNINFEGSGNRNLTPGDSIFHCHLYPHFATGMWGLWRVHDTFEAGTPDRNLPDGEIAEGTPTPALVPLPKFAMPPMPTWAPTRVVTKTGKEMVRPAFPGYPHYIAALPGHRPPQPPLDMAHDGGLPRHVITNVVDAEFGERGRFDVQLEKANLKLLPPDGTPPEQAAMAFHAGRFPEGAPYVTPSGFPAAIYKAYTPEGKYVRFVVNGQPPKPGAPYANPCPPSAPERQIRLAYLQVNLVTNNAGWHDPQARIMVHEEDVDATFAGTRKIEPLVMRANSGECVVLEASNLIPGFLRQDDFQIFAPTDTIGQHVHLVKFDVTSSDGATNGFNYEDGTFSPDTVVERIEAANAAGGAWIADGTLDPGGERRYLTPRAHPRIPSAPYGTQSTIQRWWADPIQNATGMDRTVTSAFTHDHFSPSSHQQHGFYATLSVQPAGSVWRNPVTGDPLGVRPDGGPTSLRADIIVGPNGAQSYREFLVSIADFALLYDADGKPVNPPTAEEADLPIAIDHPDGVVRPEAISARDPGSMLVNYRHEPIPLRIGRPEGDTLVQKDGDEGAMEHVFNSNVHGDPVTSLFESYQGDMIEFRMNEGAHEEMHMWSVHGVKWLREPDDAQSGWTNFQPVGLSEHFEARFRTPPVTGWVADYLYLSTPTDDLWNGVWGLFRTYRKQQPNLLPLPNNPQPEVHEARPSCPPQAPVRSYTVHAITAKDNLPDDRLFYNVRFDLFDPDAILFVKAEHLDAIRSGARRPEPLVLRAAAGECIQVTLINELPQVLQKTPHWNIVPPIIDKFNVNQVRISPHVALHPQLVQFDVTRDDGANVGINPVQTVAPGETRVYQWYAGDFTVQRVPFDPVLATADNVIADDGEESLLVFQVRPVEFGAVNLRSYADVVNHGTHGLLGSLVVEPLGATWVADPDTDSQATVFFQDPTGTDRSFREGVIIYQDEIALHSRNPLFQCVSDLNCGTALRPYGAADDAEDSGGKGFNYRTEPLWARFGVAPEVAPAVFNDIDISNALSSLVFGDPETPIVSARAGDELRLRVTSPSGHPRMHAFTLHGHAWDWNPYEDGSNSTRFGLDPTSFRVGTVGHHGAMSVINVVPGYGAGGPFRVEGDFLYREQSSFQFPAGLWGILRVGPPAGASPPVSQN